MKGGRNEPINRFRFENVRQYLDADITTGMDYGVNIILSRNLYGNLWRVFLNRVQGKRTILDITDDLFVGRHEETLRERLKRRFVTKNAVKWLVQSCDAVVCSSEELRDRYASYSRSIHYIEDAIDVDPSWKKEYTSRNPRIVWVGTSSNLYHLLPLENVLKRLQEREGVEITLISKKSAPSNLIAYLRRDFNFRYSLCEWDLATYIPKIMENDIAIAPISPDNRSAAKSSNKLFTYMYHGMPVVASRIKEYERHIENGKNGYLAAREEEWYEYLLLLLRDHEKREKIGSAAREYAHGIFSVKGIADRWNDVIRNVQKTT